MSTFTRSSRSSLSGTLVLGIALAFAMVGAPRTVQAALKIGLVLKPLDNTYFGAMARGAEAAVKEFGVGLTTVAATSLTDDAGQASQLAALDASGEYGAYIVNPVSPTNLLQPLSSVVKKGQPVMNIDLPIDLDAAGKEDVTITSYMGSDNVATGAAAGEYMVTILPAGSTVALIGGLPADPGSLARMKGFSNAVAGKLKIIQTVASNADRLKAQQDAASIIRAHPDIGGFFTVSGDMSLGIRPPSIKPDSGARSRSSALTARSRSLSKFAMASAGGCRAVPIHGLPGVEACIAVRLVRPFRRTCQRPCWW